MKKIFILIFSVLLITSGCGKKAEQTENNTGENNVDVIVDEIGNYINGEIVYYNPITNEKCDNYLEKNSETEYLGNLNNDTQNGCLKWYKYFETQDSKNIKLLLDHNTTARVQWDSDATRGRNVSFQESKNVQTELAKLKTIGKWNKVLNPTLISAKEVAYITKSDSNFNKDVGTTWFYFDGVDKEKQKLYTWADLPFENKLSDYYWLFDNLHECTLQERYCLNDDNGLYFVSNDSSMSTNYNDGYWTSTHIENTDENEYLSVWNISKYGELGVSLAHTPLGIRPVITIPKSILE